MFTKNDLGQIEEHGLSLNDVQNQLKRFSEGFPTMQIVTAASINNGIEVINRKDRECLTKFYENARENLEVVKFVPASGAATRMFKFLHVFLDDFKPNEQLFSSYVKQDGNKAVGTFFSSLADFPFVNEVRREVRKNYPDYKHYKKGPRHYCFAKMMLDEKGLNYSWLPKGLIPFHKYNKYATTAFEEQLYEAAFYASVKNQAYFKFTFSERHVDVFQNQFEAIKNRLAKKTKTNFNISYSFQQKQTDTLAATLDNKPFRDKDGKLVFRPSGHGALLANLNEVNADLIFIKNIDNVVAEEYVEETAHYKKVLAGKLLWLQEKLFGYLKVFENEVNGDVLAEVKSFLWNHLNIKQVPEEKSTMIKLLNRPLRVCGVVKNTGAPGGGPFWVREKGDRISLQIVEVSQINAKDAHQKNIVDEATHFNPVDIVCGVRDYKGEKFDLTNFADFDMGFISEKSLEGQPLKALELPGLWNGSMADWNSVFIEVPLITFNPVKTVNDLLAKEHRPNA